MMLTKEKCENALTNIICNIGVIRSDYRTSGKAKEDYCTLKSLIEEHFSNPPLKFEELKEGMFVWDNARKEWVKVEAQREMYTKIVECWVIDWVLLKTYEFEPNRFYRKEVVE